MDWLTATRATFVQLRHDKEMHVEDELERTMQWFTEYVRSAKRSYDVFVEGQALQSSRR